MRLGRASIFFVSLALGCAPPLTEVLVVIDTDFAVPAELDRIELEVRGPEGEMQSAAGDLEGAGELPSTVGLVHRGGPLGGIEVTARGLQAGSVRVERRASFTFVEGEVRVLRLSLLRSCAGVDCGLSETCADAGCRSVEVTMEELEAYVEPLRRTHDGGLGMDAGPEGDAGPLGDAGPGVDGGADAGPDAGREPRPPCTDLPASCGVDGSACSCDRCTCSVRCSGDCAVVCRDTDQCVVDASSSGGDVDVTCENAVCDIDAEGSSNTVVVANGSDAEINCRGASNCDVDCTGGSRCLVRCQAASNCGIRTCEGSRASCAMQVEVCNQRCP